MPLAKVTTSQTVERSQAEEVLSALSQGLSGILGKPERFLATALVDGAAMTFAGSTEPAAVVEICNIGELDKSQTEQMSRFACACLHQRLTVKTDRIYVLFFQFERHLWGTSAGTFA